MRTLWLGFGFLFLVIGLIGIVLPLLPTTPFLLLAAYFFSKSSKKWHNWLIHHKIFGPPILDWQKYKMIRPRTKVLAVSMIMMGVPSVWFFVPLLKIKIFLFLIMLSAVAYILTRNSKPVL